MEEREKAREKAKGRRGRRRGEKAREKRKKVKMKSEKVGGEKVVKETMTRGAAMILGASQPTLALGRQTSNCHVGQD